MPLQHNNRAAGPKVTGKPGRVFLLLAGLLAGWVLIDLLVPRKGDFRRFDPAGVAQLDGAMWRAYYEQKPVLLAWQSAKLLREQVHAPFWRSFVMAYHAAKAAFLVKDWLVYTSPSPRDWA